MTRSDRSFLPLGGLSEIASQYRVLLVDAWGTLHDGHTVFDGVNATMIRARAAGLVVVVVTNSPRRTVEINAHLQMLGLMAQAFDHVACSGELAWEDFGRLCVVDGLRRVCFIANTVRADWFGGLPVELVPLDQADIAIAYGMPYDTEDAALASPLAVELARASARGVPLLVADSDGVYPQAGRLRLGPGWIASHYAKLGGTVVEYGKPFDPIYDAAIELAGGPEAKDILMIGDNLATDIQGAQRRGFDSVLVLAGGVHGGCDGAALRQKASAIGARPTYIADCFSWSPFKFSHSPMVLA